MDFSIGDIIFDADRMVFYSASLSKKERQVIHACIPVNDNYDELCAKMNSLDPDRMNAKKCLPTTAGICLTYKCQLNCNYCSFCSQKSGKELKLEEVFAFVDFLLRRHLVRQIARKQKEDFIIFFTGGGEPTQNWTLFQSTVKYIKNKCSANNIQCQIHLTTNGMLNETQTKYIYDNCSTIMVSYDGITSVQDRNRKMSGGGKSSTVVERTIAMLDRLHATYTIRTTIWQYDFDKLFNMVDYIYTHFSHHKGWSISPILVRGRAIENMEDTYLNSDKYNFINSFVSAADYALHKYGAGGMSIQLFPNSRTDIFCGSGYVMNPWLMPDGTVVTCLEAKEGVPMIGSVKDGRVELYQKYTDELLKEYRSRFLSASCRNCFAFRFCRVGCPLKFEGDKYSGRDSASWICDMTRYYWKYVIQTIADGKHVFGWYAKKMTIPELNHMQVYEMKEV